MDYIELNCRVHPIDPYVEIVIARLAELGFEMFEESEEGVKAYIGAHLFEENYQHLFDDLKNEASFSFVEQLIPHQNWNEVWESNFEPVVLAGKVYVRAAFHPHRPEFPYTIVIQPKMAFGTGHHATTSLVMEQMLTLKLQNRKVMDMGCGTGILAILAHLLGANDITAVDNDPVAAENTSENCRINNSENIKVLHGDVTAMKNNTYDIILANINRNIILADISHYVKSLADKGFLVLSGFYTDDIPMIMEAALSLGLVRKAQAERDRWCCLVLQKSE